MPETKPISEVNKELYEVLADKTLSFGCKLSIQDSEDHYQASYIGGSHGAEYCNVLVDGEDDGLSIYQSDIAEIIGHEPTRNDVIRHLIKRYQVTTIQELFDKLNPDDWVDGYSRPREKKREAKKAYVWSLLMRDDMLNKFPEWSEETKRKLWQLICKK